MPFNNPLFHSNLDHEKIFMARLMTILSTILFISGIGLDYVSTHESFEQMLHIRLVVCSALIITCMTTFKRDFFLKHYLYMCGATYFIAAFSIIMMIHHTNVNEIAHGTYFAGLMLVIVTVFLGTYIDTITSIAISALMIATFVFMSIYGSSVLHMPTLINNLFFLSSSVVVGIISNTMRNKFLIEKIFLQDRLKDSLREERELVNEQTHLANMDALTNIPNKRYAKEKLEKMRIDAEKLDMALVILFMDLNKFKFINDTYGHNVGDSVLTIVANRLEGLIRKNDLVSRQGGDEFLIAFLVDKENMDYVQNIEQNIEETITKTMVVEGLRLAVGVSVGTAIYPFNGLSVTALLEMADVKMYKDKKEKHDSYNFSETTDVDLNVTRVDFRSRK